jgi:glutathione-regulated potassium-efflux system ancillary protein KefC
MLLLALAVAFTLGFAMRLVGLPPMLGFLIAGFALQALGVENTPAIDRIANMGVLLLLFTIGLKLNIKSLFRKHVWQGGAFHMLLTVLIFSIALAGMRLLGFSYFDPLSATNILLTSFALSFSSTVFAVKVLEEKGEMKSLMGKTAIAILIIQDILAVLFLTFSKGQYPSAWALLLLGFPLLRKPLLWMMHRTGHGEMMVLYGLLLALGGAEVFTLVGMKADLGALAAGLVVANTTKSEELSKVLLNFKEFFLVAFFLSIGLIGQPAWWMLGIAVIFALLLPVKSFLYFWILTRYRLRARTSFWISLSLTNYSEFALIVGAVAASSGMINADWLLIVAITVALSFLISSALNTKVYYAQFELFLAQFESAKRLADDRAIQLAGAEILVFGMDKLGTMTYDYMDARFGKLVIGLDADYNVVLDHKKQHRNVIIGDATDSGFWENLEPGDVSLVLLAMNNFTATKTAVQRLQLCHFSGKIAAVSRFDDEMAELQRMGVDSVFNLYEEAGIGFAEHVCETFYVENANSSGHEN